jgi:uncharacterized protein
MNTKPLGLLALGMGLGLCIGLASAQTKAPAGQPSTTPIYLSSPLGKPNPSTLQNATFTNAPQGSFSSRVNAAAGVAPAGPSANAPSGAGSGAGAGTHGAGSPIAPLVEKAGVVSWSVLTELKTKTEKNRILPVFNASQMALNQKTQKLQGFMMPLEPGERQKHFLLTSVPMSCGFCVPGGPESMVEVRTKTPIKYTLDAVVVEGKFTVLSDDPYGLYYRVTDAVSAN